jgi:hypothetical protein
MRSLLRSLALAVGVALLTHPAVLAQVATPATPVASPACADRAALDLVAVTLTSEDLAAAGLDGFGNSSAGHFIVADDVAYLEEMLQRDASEIEPVLSEAGFSGSYFVTQRLPADPADPASPAVRDVEIGIFPFADAAGARAGYDLLSDERGVTTAADVDDAKPFGDASEMTRISGERDLITGQPFQKLELEILRGCLVVVLSLYDYGPDAAEPKLAEIEALGARLLPRIDAVLAGRAPRLDRLALRLQTPDDLGSFIFYAMLDGEGVREWFETDVAFAARQALWTQLGIESALRRESAIPFGTAALGDDLIHYNMLLRFPNEATASAYVQGVADRFAANPEFSAVRELDARALGDESVALALERETDGVAWTLNEVFARVGNLVAVSWMEGPNPGPQGPEVAIEPLLELAVAQVACLEADGACPPAPVPDGLPDTQATPVATPMS